jgi:hypothetical protein
MARERTTISGSGRFLCKDEAVIQLFAVEEHSILVHAIVPSGSPDV